MGVGGYQGESSVGGGIQEVKHVNMAKITVHMYIALARTWVTMTTVTSVFTKHGTAAK